MTLTRSLAAAGLVLLFMGTGCAADIKPVPVQRCPDVDVPANFDPATPDSVVQAIHGGPRILYGLGTQRHALLQRMLGDGENPNVCVLSFSVLTLETRSGDLQAVKILLDGGAHPDKPATSDGQTPLLAGLAAGRFDAANVLLDHGADPLATTDGGVTALHSLAQTVPPREDAAAQLAMAEELLRRGLRVDAQTLAWHDTPLMFAALRGNKDLVILLLKHHADAALTNKQGQTAAAFAEKKGYTDIAQLLRSAEQR
jgi:hypothetical protein